MVDDMKDLREGSYTMEYGNRPIFSTEFGKIVHILGDFGKREYFRTRKFCNFEGRNMAKLQSYGH